MFIHVVKNSTIIMAIFLSHPAGEPFFVYGRTFAAIMPLQTAVIIEVCAA